MCITRCLIRWGLVGGLGLGALTLLVGPERVAAGFAHIRGKAQHVVDHFVDDPVALRRQLQSLAEQYPDRIAEVRGEIAQVEHQLGQYQHDMQIAQRVVAMTGDHLGQLKTLVARAEESAKTTARPVSIRFEGSKFNIEEAYNEARRINNVRGTYQDRLASDQQQVTFLTQQKARLQEILDKLDSEYNTFQAQLWQLDRQIDAIERNERLITLTEQQQQTLASYEKFGKIGNLKQLEGKLAELRAIQEAQLESLSKKGVHMDYENRAEYDMSTESMGENPFADVPPHAPHNGECDDSDADAAPASNGDSNIKPSSKSFVFAEPIVVE